MRYGLQSKPGEKEKTKVSKLGQVLNFQYLDLPWSWSGEYSLVDTPTDSKDSKDISTALQFKIPIEPIKLGLELSFAESQRKSADNITKIRQKSTKTAGALLVAYPISAKMILEFSHRYEVQQTNNPGFDYHKNVDMLNFILIF